MARSPWTCLFVSNGVGMIPDSVAFAIQVAASSMNDLKVELRQFRSDTCGGRIMTNWQVRIVGERSGVLFHAEVEYDLGENQAGSFQMNFLMNEAYLARGAAELERMAEEDELEQCVTGGTFTIPELYDFDWGVPRMH